MFIELILYCSLKKNFELYIKGFRPIEEAIITNGGDAPGLNAVTRAIVRTATANGIESYGFIEGFRGLLDNNYIRLDGNPAMTGLLPRGGAVLGSSLHTNVFNLNELINTSTIGIT